MFRITLGRIRFAKMTASPHLAPYSLLVLLLFTSEPAVSETLKEEAERLCHAYIDQPQEFKPVETQACSLVPEDETATQSALCFTHGAEDSSQPTRFARFRSMGTCGSTPVGEVDDQGRARELAIRNVNVNGYGMGLEDTALDYQGHLLVTNGDDLRLVLGHEQVILCMFMYRFQGWQAPEPADRQVCQKVSQNGFEVRVSSIMSRSPKAEPMRQDPSDLNGDGRDEVITSYGYSSGAGCGCEAGPLLLSYAGGAVVRKDGRLAGEPDASRAVTLPPDVELLGHALEDLTMSCGSSPSRTAWSVVRIDGQDYVLAYYQPRPWEIQHASQAGQDVYSWGKIPRRELYQFQGDKFVKVCNQEPITQKVIAHDVIPKGQQYGFGYTPLE
jgi:hypothetical protein